MIEARSQAVCRHPPGGFVVQRKSIGERRAEKRVAKRTQAEPQGRLRNLFFLMTDAQLRDEALDRVEDGIERIAVAGEDHPGCERTGAFAAERVEGHVDDVARVGFAGTRTLHRIGNAGDDRIRDGAGKLRLQARGRSEMMEQVGVGPADLGRNGFQRDRLRTLLEQKFARRGEGGGTAFFRGEARASY